MPGPYALSGSGIQSVVSCSFLQVTITNLPLNVESGAANPPNYYHVALITPGSALGWHTAVPVTQNPMLIPVTPEVTQFGYACQRGATLSVTEVSTGYEPFPPGGACVARGSFSANGFHTAYTVPAGNVLLLKDVRLNQFTSVDNTLQLWISDGPDSLKVFEAPPATDQVAAVWSGWLALNAGDLVVLGQTASEKVVYWVSGAVLPFNGTL